MNTLNFIDLDARKKELHIIRHMRIIAYIIMPCLCTLVCITAYKGYAYYIALQNYHTQEQQLRNVSAQKKPNVPKGGVIALQINTTKLVPNSRLLRDVTQQLTSSMWFTEFKQNTDARATIKGMSKNITDIYHFTKSVQMLSYVKHGILQGVIEQPIKNNNTYFSFTLILECTST